MALPRQCGFHGDWLTESDELIANHAHNVNDAAGRKATIALIGLVGQPAMARCREGTTRIDSDIDRSASILL